MFVVVLNISKRSRTTTKVLYFSSGNEKNLNAKKNGEKGCEKKNGITILLLTLQRNIYSKNKKVQEAEEVLAHILRLFP